MHKHPATCRALEQLASILPTRQSCSDLPTVANPTFHIPVHCKHVVQTRRPQLNRCSTAVTTIVCCLLQATRKKAQMPPDVTDAMFRTLVPDIGRMEAQASPSTATGSTSIQAFLARTLGSDTTGDGPSLAAVPPGPPPSTAVASPRLGGLYSPLSPTKRK
jgi:hypothetical protein